jgi:hypothetical protein
MIYMVSLACFTHFYRVFIRLNRWEDLNWNQLLPQRIAAIFAVALIQTSSFGITFWDYYVKKGGNVYWHLGFLAIATFLMIGAWSAIYYAYHIDQR